MVGELRADFTLADFSYSSRFYSTCLAKIGARLNFKQQETFHALGENKRMYEPGRRKRIRLTRDLITSKGIITVQHCHVNI